MTNFIKFSGQTLIPETKLLAKKELMRQKSKNYKNIISTIKNRQDIYDQFVLSLTYNSNSIEGSTLTKADTAAVIFDNASLPDKSLVEHLEAKNHQSALEFLFNQVSKDYKVSEEFVLKLHSILMNSIKPDAGIYRNHGVRIVGTNVPTANYLKVPELMKTLIKDINKSIKDTIKHVSEVHSRFEQIHPFSDGNGRIGRRLIHVMLLRRNLPPAVIQQKNRKQYYTSLNKSQRESEFNLFEDFTCAAVLCGFDMF